MISYNITVQNPNNGQDIGCYTLVMQDMNAIPGKKNSVDRVQSVNVKEFGYEARQLERRESADQNFLVTLPVQDKKVYDVRRDRQSTKDEWLMDISRGLENMLLGAARLLSDVKVQHSVTAGLEVDPRAFQGLRIKEVLDPQMSYDSRSISSQQHHYQKSYDKVEAHVFDREGEKARTVYLEDLVDHLQDPAKPIGIRTRYVSVEMTLNPLEQQIEVTSVPSHPHLSNVGHIDFDPEQDELRVVMSCQYDDDLASHRDMNIQLTQNLAVTDQTDFQQALRYLVVGHCAVAKSEALRLREDPDRRVAKVKAKPEVNGFRPRGFSQQKNH